jgi:hypothetical protein
MALSLKLDELMGVLVALGDYQPDAIPQFSPSERDKLQTQLDRFAIMLDAGGHQKGALFGYFSILHENYDFTGHYEQSAVPPEQVQRAKITGYEITPVISANYYGSAGLTGVAVGLSPKKDTATEGVAVIIPIEDPVWDIKKAVARFINREIIAEHFSPDETSLAAKKFVPQASHMMYELVAGVTYLQDGAPLPCLFVRTNMNGAKNPSNYHGYIDPTKSPETMRNFLAYQMAFGDGTEFWHQQFGKDDYGDSPNGLRYFTDAVNKRLEMGYAVPENLTAIMRTAQEMRGYGDTIETARSNFDQAVLDGKAKYPGAGAIPIYFGDALARLRANSRS